MTKRIYIGTDERGSPDYFEEAPEECFGVVVDVPDELWANWLSAEASYEKLRSQIIALHDWPKRELPPPMTEAERKAFLWSIHPDRDKELLEGARRAGEEAGRKHAEIFWGSLISAIESIPDDPMLDSFEEVEPRVATIEISGVARIGSEEIAKAMPPDARLPLKDQSGIEIGYACEFRECNGSTICDVYIHPGATINSLAELLGATFPNEIYPIEKV